MKRFLPIFFAVSFCSLVFPQPVSRVLSQTDIDRFLRDFPLMVAEFEASDISFEETMDDAQEDSDIFSPAILRGVLAEAQKAPEVRQVLAKFGWNQRFWDVYYTIFTGVYVSMIDQVLSQYPNPEFEVLLDRFRNSIHREDLALVVRNLETLMKVFSPMEEE